MTDRKKWEEAVKGPGKFEQCSPWVPYFYDLMLGGCAVETDGPYFVMQVSDEDIAIFPELKLGDLLYFYKDNDGFVCEVDEADVIAYEADVIANAELSDDEPPATYYCPDCGENFISEEE